MLEPREAAVRNLEPAQAAELSVLVELEARWENLRKTPAQPHGSGATTQDLQGIQKAYEAFRSKLAAYNKRYVPAHVPEMLLNTPSRLAVWCRSMQQLYLRVEHDPRAPCPAHLLEKAYRWAERVSVRLNQDHVSRPTPPGTISAAIQALEVLGRWCDDLAERAAPPATPEATTASP
jgi:hypothetical protein